MSSRFVGEVKCDQFTFHLDIYTLSQFSADRSLMRELKEMMDNLFKKLKKHSCTRSVTSGDRRNEENWWSWNYLSTGILCLHIKERFPSRVWKQRPVEILITMTKKAHHKGNPSITVSWGSHLIQGLCRFSFSSIDGARHRFQSLEWISSISFISQ